jgi:hypothetical protein
MNAYRSLYTEKIVKILGIHCIPMNISSSAHDDLPYLLIGGEQELHMDAIHRIMRL